MMSLPKSFRKLCVTKLTPNFREAVHIVSVPLKPPPPNQILVKVNYVGINASDIVISAGGWSTDGGKTPFDLGLEALGTIAMVGESITGVKVGQPAIFWSLSSRRAYAEYLYLNPEEIIIVPQLRADFLGLLVCGLTAAIGLDTGAVLKPNEKIVITAAAGGLGHIAVQWAKNVKNAQVIALCSTDEKVQTLNDLGCCDLIINYKTQNYDEILTQKYPQGIDVIWETVGSTMFKTLAKHVAPKGRLVSVGATSTYKCPDEPRDVSLPKNFHTQSRKIVAFSIAKHKNFYDEYIRQLFSMIQNGQLRVVVDMGLSTPDGLFEELHGVVKAVEYLHSGKSIGKVIAKINDT